MDSEYKLIPVEILDNPKQSKIIGEAQHTIFEKLKIELKRLKDIK